MGSVRLRSRDSSRVPWIRRTHAVSPLPREPRAAPSRIAHRHEQRARHIWRVCTETRTHPRRAVVLSVVSNPAAPRARASGTCNSDHNGAKTCTSIPGRTYANFRGAEVCRASRGCRPPNPLADRVRAVRQLLAAVRCRSLPNSDRPRPPARGGLDRPERANPCAWARAAAWAQRPAGSRMARSVRVFRGTRPGLSACHACDRRQAVR
jgi:hypothetical protein